MPQFVDMGGLHGEFGGNMPEAFAGALFKGQIVIDLNQDIKPGQTPAFTVTCERGPLPELAGQIDAPAAMPEPMKTTRLGLDTRNILGAQAPRFFAAAARYGAQAPSYLRNPASGDGIAVGLATLTRQFEDDNGLPQGLSPADLRTARKAIMTAVLYSVEGLVKAIRQNRPTVRDQLQQAGAKAAGGSPAEAQAWEILKEIVTEVESMDEARA